MAQGERAPATQWGERGGGRAERVVGCGKGTSRPGTRVRERRAARGPAHRGSSGAKQRASTAEKVLLSIRLVSRQSCQGQTQEKAVPVGSWDAYAIAI